MKNKLNNAVAKTAGWPFCVCEQTKALTTKLNTYFKAYCLCDATTGLKNFNVLPGLIVIILKFWF